MFSVTYSGDCVKYKERVKKTIPHMGDIAMKRKNLMRESLF